MAYSARIEAERYAYRVGSSQYFPLMADDIFKLSVRVNLSTSPPRLLLYSHSQTLSCQSFFEDGQFLRTTLSRIHLFIEPYIEEIIEAVTSDVRRLFQVDGSVFPSLASQPREVNLWLEVTLFDTSLLVRTEESTQRFRTVPASNEVIQKLLKKPTVVAGDSCCTICLEELDANAECRTLPCDHVYHQQCIVSWLQINHVCPVCRYSLPTREN